MIICIISLASLFTISCYFLPNLWTKNPTVTKVTISSPQIPRTFDGYRIIHISDLHCDYMQDETLFARMIDSIQQLRPDIIAVTGDIVTFKSLELKRFLSILQQVKAKDGVFLVLGNHDYGTYYRWKSTEQLAQNQNQFLEYIQILQWILLKNESYFIVRQSDTIVIAGTENQSLKKTFYPSSGDYNKALHNISEKSPVILLTHDPTYWTKEIAHGQRDILLTLSGHTHGMQIGYRTTSSSWSILKFFRKDWGCLLEQNHRFLYVNTGLGNVGLPFRLGLNPEITLLILSSTEKITEQSY